MTSSRIIKLIFSICAVLSFAALAESSSQAQCRDPWVTDNIRAVYGRGPIGAGESGECNIKLYNNGSWNSKDELKGYVQGVKNGLAAESVKFAVFKISPSSFTTGLIDNANKIIAAGAGNITAEKAGIIAAGAGNDTVSPPPNIIAAGAVNMSVFYIKS